MDILRLSKTLPLSILNTQSIYLPSTKETDWHKYAAGEASILKKIGHKELNLYISIFKNSKILNVSRYHEDGADISGIPKGDVMTIEFKLKGQEFIAKISMVYHGKSFLLS